jgi:hypothetical protein
MDMISKILDKIEAEAIALPVSKTGNRNGNALFNIAKRGTLELIAHDVQEDLAFRMALEVSSYKYNNFLSKVKQ